MTTLILEGTAYTFEQHALANCGITEVTYQNVMYDVWDEENGVYNDEQLVAALKNGGCVINGTLFMQ